MPRLSSLPLGSSSPGHAAPWPEHDGGGKEGCPHDVPRPREFSRRQIRDLILAAVAETNRQREVHLAIDMMVVFRETHANGVAPRDPHEGMGPRAAAPLSRNFFTR